MRRILFAVGIVFIIVFVLLWSIFSPCNSDEWIKIIQVSITAAGFAGALSSLNIALNRAERNKSLEGVSLFDKFIDERMRDIRRDAWKVKIKWEQEKGYKEKLLNLYSIGNRNKRTKEQEEELFEFFKVMQLIAFYNMLSLHDQHIKTIIKLNYFYFDWWRKFLFEVAHELDKTRVKDNSHPKSYLENTSYTTSLDRLDKMLGLDTFPKDRDMIVHDDSIEAENGIEY